MPSLNVDISDYVDIDVDEFLDRCDSSEIEEVIEYLQENNHLIGNQRVLDGQRNLFDIEWEETLSKLASARTRLTNEEEEIIKNIAKRF